MYFFRLLDVLRDDYPKLLAAVGDAPSTTWSPATWRPARPPTRSIARAGAAARLPDGTPLAPGTPLVGRAGGLERAYTELFDGPDAAPLTLDALKALAPDRADGAHPAPDPLPPRADSPLRHRAALATHSGRAPHPTRPRPPETLLVWRQDIDVYHRPIDEEERALFALVDGHDHLAGLRAIPARSDAPPSAVQRWAAGSGRPADAGADRQSDSR